MPHPYPLASVFTGGMRRDVDRTELPGGSAYNMVDFIPDEIQAITGGRGGWTYAGATTGSASALTLGYHSSLGVVVATDGASLWNAITAASLGTGQHLYAASPPSYHRGYLFYGSALFTGIPQAPAALKDDSTMVNLTNAPKAQITGVYKDHALLAKLNSLLGPSGAAQRNRLWFSAAGDPTTWDLTYGWWDTTGDITALATLTNSILIFHGDSVERLRGTTPPPGSDMVLEPLFNDGCIDAFSIAYWQQRVIFASSRGIYLTDGMSVVDLTAQAQMKSYWTSLMTGYTSSWRVSAGIYRDHYIISINNGSTLIDCLCVSLQNRTMWRFSNVHGGSFLNVTNATQEKLYMGTYNIAGRVAELSSLWSPSASVKQDGDGTNPTPIVETGMFRGYDRLHRRWIESMGKQKWRWGYVDYDLRDSASDNPTSALSYCQTPTGAYTQAGLAIPKTTDVGRVRRALNPTQGGATHSQMLGLKYAVTGPYASAKLYTLEGVFEPIDIGAL